MSKAWTWYKAHRSAVMAPVWLALFILSATRRDMFWLGWSGIALGMHLENWWHVNAQIDRPVVGVPRVVGSGVQSTTPKGGNGGVGTPTRGRAGNGGSANDAK